MNTATHTPTPWTADDGAVWFGDRPIRVLIADCSPAGGNDHAVGDAAFIVRACNSHGDLVAALRTVYAALKSDAKEPDTSGDVTVYRLDGGVMYQAINTVRAALAKAGAA